MAILAAGLPDLLAQKARLSIGRADEHAHCR
jgi:hypothetical protein